MLNCCCCTLAPSSLLRSSFIIIFPSSRVINLLLLLRFQVYFMLLQTECIQHWLFCFAATVWLGSHSLLGERLLFFSDWTNLSWAPCCSPSGEDEISDIADALTLLYAGKQGWTVASH